MADSNRGRISYIKESTRGTTPSGNLQRLNVASETLTANVSSTSSQIIKDDGNLHDQVRTSFDPGGGITTELGHEFNDEFLEGAFRNAFDSAISIAATTISVDASGSPVTIDDSGSGFGSIKVNDVIMVAGFTDSNNNGAYLVTAAAAGSLDVEAMDATKTPATEAAGDSVTIKTTRLSNANTSSYFSIERYYTDVSEYMSWLGMEIDTMSVSFGAGSVPQVSFTFLGDTHSPISATIGTGYTAASTNKSIDTVDGFIGGLMSNDGGSWSNQGGCLTAVTFNISNSVRRTQVLDGTKKAGKGSFNMTVDFTMIFENDDFYQIFQNNGYTSLSAAVVDDSNQGIAITVPKIRYTSGSAPIPGLNQDVQATFQGQAVGTTVGSDTYTAILSKIE